MLTHLAPPPPEAGSDEAATEPTAAGKAGPAVPKGAVEVVDLSELEEDSISVANAATTAQIATPGASKASNAEKAAENTPAVANGAASAGSSKKPAGKSAPSSSSTKKNATQRGLESFFSKMPAGTPSSVNVHDKTPAKASEASPMDVDKVMKPGPSSSKSAPASSKAAAKAKGTASASKAKPKAPSKTKPADSESGETDDSGPEGSPSKPHVRKRRASTKSDKKAEVESGRKAKKPKPAPQSEDEESPSEDEEEDDEESEYDVSGAGEESESESSDEEEEGSSDESGSGPSDVSDGEESDGPKKRRKSSAKGKGRAESPVVKRKLKRPNKIVSESDESEADTEPVVKTKGKENLTSASKESREAPASDEGEQSAGPSDPKPSKGKGKGKEKVADSKKKPATSKKTAKATRKGSESASGSEQSGGESDSSEKRSAESKAPRIEGQPVVFKSEEEMEREWASRGAPADDVDMQDAEGENEDDAAPGPSSSKAAGAKGKGKAKAKPAASKKQQAKLNFKKQDAASGAEEEEEDEEQGATSKSEITRNLPPLRTPQQHIADQVSRINSPERQMLSQVIERLGGRPLRVATMCSGTEAPIIALQKISKALLEDHQREFKFESVFSCEIEPFKQAYIERNFKPPILFRDVCELGNGYAHTAYGSLVAVPGQVDLLVAGTSCVDYSGLNTKQKGLEDGGESGQTFMGMLRYVKKENPTIVILENVSGAPWTDEIQEKKRQKATNSRARENVGKSIEGYFREIGYFGSFVRVDTKEFSLPHTRVRGYFMATKVKGLSEGWKEETVGLKRGWTVPMDGYLLPADHPDIAKARAFYARKQSGEGGRNSRTDWSRCESRHARARLEEMLGNRRPLTQWKEAGVVKGLDHTWNDWLAAQTERVVDLLDINMLREAMRGVDPNYKSYLWNVSQNVDRSTASGHIGLAPCLTPAMIPYLPARGGPATGREALALQGIDYMDLHLTVETEDNLADLAGNAMSTPVVSAAMLAALAVSASLLKPGDGSEGRGETLIAGSHSVEVVEDENLQNGTIDLTHSQSTSLKDLLKRAHINARRCICEGGLKSASTGILQCVACLTTTCGACGGRPEHMLCSFDGSDLSEQDWLSKSSGPVAEAKKSSGEDAEVKDSDAAAEGAVPALPSDVSLERQPPQVFERELKALVPMVVNLEGFSRESLDELFQASGRGVAAADWDMWASVVQKVRGTTFYFRSLARESCWVATYMSAVARLELRLHHAQPEWLLFATPTPDLAVGSRLRALLGNPVARRRLDLDADQLMPNGSWEILLPAKAVFQADFTGCGDLVDSWQASLGIEHPDFKDTKRWSRWTVEVPIEVEAELDRPISGTYVLLDKCGTSQSSLHRKLASDSDTHLPPLYLFHAPSLTGPLDEDAFVFSTDLSRGGFEYYRPIVAQLEASWRTHDRNGTAKIDLTVNGRWVPAPSIKFAEAEAGARGVEYKMADTLDTKVSQSNCRHAHTVLACEFPLPVSADGSIDELWRSEGWRDIDLRREGSSTFPKIAFITSRLPEIAVSGETATEATDCPLCAPKAPAIKWVRGTKGFIPIEDAAEATAYEIALKNRPTPFVVQVRADRGASTGYLRVAINTDSLAHQALASLPKRSADLAHHVVWKLNQDYTSGHEHVQRLFNLSSNRNDPQHAPPRHFKSNVHLRPEQLRSLTWMIEQETIPAHFTFEEKEIAEADLPSFGLRVEAQAKRSVQARGGVIADQVGYGKTAISIALISETKESTLPVGDSDLIPLKATLVIVPGHLTKQWLSEIAKFVSKGHLEVLAIKDAKDLSKYSIKDLEKADVILVPDRLLDSPVYWERFTYFSAHPGTLPDDKTGGRMFRETLQGAMENLRKQARRFRDGKFDEASAAIAQAQKDAAALAAEEARVAQEEAAKGRKAAKSKKEPKEPKKPKAKAGKDDVKSDLKDKSVKENFKNLKGLPFQFFHFKRIIADEFTYLKGRTLVSILGLEASARWILSGTPPVEDFGAIKGIAAHLGIHLGIDDDRQGLSVAKNNKDKTAAERFHGFRDVRSSAWHASRDDLAQAFLDQFVRQNVAEIDEIRRTEVIHKMNLTTAERVIYLELAHHLQSIDMQAKGPKKYKDVSMGDRASRLLEVLEDSKDAEEALLKRAAHFSPLRAEEEDKASDAVEACEGILQTRIRQRVKCQRDLASEMALCRQLANKIRELGGYPVDRQDPSRRPPIEEFCRAAFNNKLSGDRFADRLIADLLDTEGFTPAGKLKDEEDVEIGNKEKLDDVVYALREHVVIMRKLSKELAGRCRSLRFFDVIRKLQRGGEEKEAVLESCICEHRGAAGVEFGVLSCCGHVACMDCLQKFADQQRCVHDAEICAAPVRITNIVSVPTITQAGKDEHLGPFGTKLQRVVEIIKKIPKGERCLVFVQFDEMFKIVEQALLAADISCVTLAGGTAAHKAATLEKFQDPGSKMQVLLLDIDRSTASGANLTVANHIIFLSPLKTATQAQFEATETQAIGRAVRYGQTKPMVWIHRIFAMDTVDVDIMKKRRPGLKLDDGVEWTWNAGEKKWVCSGMAAEVVDLDGDGDVEMV